MSLVSLSGEAAADWIEEKVRTLELRVESLEAYITRRPQEPISDAILDATIAAREAALATAPATTQPAPDTEEPAP